MSLALPETNNMSPFKKKWWLEDDPFPFGGNRPIFRGELTDLQERLNRRQKEVRGVHEEVRDNM